MESESMRLVENEEVKEVNEDGYEIPVTPEPGEESEEQEPAENEESEDEVLQCQTAFLVLVHDDGRMYAQTDLSAKIAIRRLANFNDFYAACSVIRSDIDAMKSAERTVNAMMQVTQQAVEQQRTDALMQKVQQGGGLHVPPNRAQRRRG